MILKEILKEQEEEIIKCGSFIFFRDKLQSYNAKIIKAVCDEMTGTKSFSESGYPDVKLIDNGYNARVQEEITKAQELRKEVGK